LSINSKKFAQTKEKDPVKDYSKEFVDDDDGEDLMAGRLSSVDGTYKRSASVLQASAVVDMTSSQPAGEDVSGAIVPPQPLPNKKTSTKKTDSTASLDTRCEAGVG
jgi:hypothetical protein